MKSIHVIIRNIYNAHNTTRFLLGLGTWSMDCKVENGYLYAKPTDAKQFLRVAPVVAAKASLEVQLHDAVKGNAKHLLAMCKAYRPVTVPNDETHRQFLEHSAKLVQEIADKNVDKYVKSVDRGDNAAALCLEAVIEELRVAGLNEVELTVAEQVMRSTSTWSSHSGVFFNPVTLRGYREVCKAAAEQAKRYVADLKLAAASTGTLFAN